MNNLYNDMMKQAKGLTDWFVYWYRDSYQSMDAFTDILPIVCFKWWAGGGGTSTRFISHLRPSLSVAR